eukprot:239677-Lingulodinium_polyedra.AAC.1
MKKEDLTCVLRFVLKDSVKSLKLPKLQMSHAEFYHYAQERWNQQGMPVPGSAGGPPTRLVLFSGNLFRGVARAFPQRGRG